MMLHDQDRDRERTAKLIARLARHGWEVFREGTHIYVRQTERAVPWRDVPEPLRTEYRTSGQALLAELLHREYHPAT
jgi:hypothetical protein